MTAVPPPGPMADSSVRRARPSDAPAVGVVQAAVFREAYAGTLDAEVIAEFEPIAFSRAWRRSLEQPPEGAHALFVALVGAQVVGLVAVGPSRDPDAGADCGEVTLLGVHPDARRQGHGSRLVNAAAAHLAESGFSTVSAWLLVGDGATRAFLAGGGFEPDGAHRDRVVSADGRTVREVRVGCTLGS